MESYSSIPLSQVRDFSQKMNVTFMFIKQNFKSLFRSILFIAGPPVLIVSVLVGSVMSDFIGMSTQQSANPEIATTYFMSAGFWLQILLMMLFMIVSGVMMISTVNNYIILYDEKKTPRIEVAEVWSRVRASFWMYVGSVFLFAFLGTAVYVVLLIPFVVIVAISPFLVFIAMLLLFGVLAYLLISVSLTFFIRSYERRDFFEALGRSFKLVKGKWWSTFGLIFILYYIMMVVSYLFLIPFYIYLLIQSLHTTTVNVFQSNSQSVEVLSMIFFSLFYLVQLVLNTLPNIGIAIQYFNLVEQKEARGLIKQIETLGQTPDAVVTEEHY